MLRTALAARPIPSARSFVSTVLLTRNWENESLGALKKEAKHRGLQQSGNKATLITRLQQHERKQQLEAPLPPAPQVPKHQHVRHASTSEIPGQPSSSQITPIASSYPKEFLNVKIPSGYQPTPEIPVQIPFVPDLWESSRIKAESAPPRPEEPTTPKVLAVGGAATHYGGGPSHALYPSSGISVTPVQPAAQTNQSFWHDVADDLQVPRSLKLPAHEIPKELLEGVLEHTETSGRKSDVDHSRILDKDEKRGVWALLGLLAGSWIVAGLLGPTSAFKGAATEPEAPVAADTEKD